MWAQLIQLRKVPAACYCASSNKPLHSVKCWEFLEQLRQHQILKSQIHSQMGMASWMVHQTFTETLHHKAVQRNMNKHQYSEWHTTNYY
jgi:hypothetical protein